MGVEKSTIFLLAQRNSTERHTLKASALINHTNRYFISVKRLFSSNVIGSSQ